MVLHRRRLSSLLASFALAGGIIAGGILGASPASAYTGTNIDYYANGYVNCGNHNINDFYCLWYSPGLLNGVWGSTGTSTRCLDPPGTGCITAVFTDGDGNVRNNAASMANNSFCHVTTWVYPGFTGDWNWLHSGWGGNLTSGSIPLRNNEASINVNSC